VYFDQHTTISGELLFLLFYFRDHASLCERCLKQGRMTPVDEVHHIIPVSQGGTNDEKPQESNSLRFMNICLLCFKLRFNFAPLCCNQTAVDTFFNLL